MEQQQCDDHTVDGVHRRLGFSLYINTQKLVRVLGNFYNE